MAVDAVASVILQKLMDLLQEESFSNNKMIDKQLKEMEDALKTMRGYFMDAAKKEKTVQGITIWTDKYLKNLYDVEDSIESFALRITRQRKRLGFLMNHALFLKTFTACKMLSRKLDKIQRKINKLNDGTPDGLEDASLRSIHPQKDAGNKEDDQEEEDDDQISSMRETAHNSIVIAKEGSPSPRSQVKRTNSYKLRSIRDASLKQERWRSKLLYSYSYDEGVLFIVGYKCQVRGIMERLEGDLKGRVVPIVGKMGSGKTMLARAVYGNRKIKKRFEDGICAWVTVFKECTTTDILLNLLKEVHEKSKELDGMKIDEEVLKTRLREELGGRVYLVVLDGIQSFGQWESLKEAFPNDENGSKIMLTTRDEAFPADSTTNPHLLKNLEDEDSWTLFLKKVGLEEFPDSEDSIKKRIIQVCDGLPLNIVLLGSLFSMKKEDKGMIKDWAWILETQEEWHTSDILMLSYNDLDDHLKLCLLYMLLFPKELDIPVRRLQRLWLAEGFVKRSPQNQDIQEDVMEGYFDNLVQRSLIVVSKQRSDGSPKKCRLQGVVLEFLLDKAHDIGLFHTHAGPTCNFGKRRLIEYADGKNCQLESYEYQRLRSYISFNLQKKDIPAKEIGILLTKVIGKKGFGLLRVLDLEGVYRPSLPENLGDLFHLRYLGLRWTFLDKLPKSVAHLLYLETLDLKRTSINKIPPSIWKLKHLRHLNLNEIHLNKDMLVHSHGDSLPKLLTLWGLTVDHESPVKNGLSKLTHLRELGISFRLNKFDDDDNTCEGKPLPEFKEQLIDWISKLTDLQSLRLRSKYDSGYPADLSLKPLSGLNKLTHLYLLGKLQNFPESHHFPPNIKVLTLSVSNLKQDPMPVLGQIKSLTVLRLLANSYLGEEIVCPSDSFEGLEFLKLWKLEDLKKWELKDRAMKKLKELDIRCCKKLEGIPTRLWKQGTLKDLILTDMDEKKFKGDAEKHESSVSITFKKYKLTPLPQEYGDDVQNGMASDTNGSANGGAEYVNQSSNVIV